LISEAASSVRFFTLSLDSDTFVGNLLVLFNSMGYAVYLVLIKPVMSKYKPVTVMKWVFFTGVVFSTPLFFRQMTELSFAGFTSSAWVSLVYVVTTTTFLGYLLIIFALKYVNASTASYYVYLQPVVAAIIAFWLGLQKFTWLKVLATVLIFVGAFLVSHDNGKSTKNKSSYR
jgi:drug/metabolite transporter (DMT)-like permease